MSCDYLVDDACQMTIPPTHRASEWFCSRLCPMITGVKSVVDIKVKYGQSQPSVVLFRSLAAYAQAICLACPDVQSCPEYARHVAGKSKCGCAKDIPTLASECHKQAFDLVVVNNWAEYRDKLDPAGVFKAMDDKKLT